MADEAPRHDSPAGASRRRRRSRADRARDGSDDAADLFAGEAPVARASGADEPLAEATARPPREATAATAATRAPRRGRRSRSKAGHAGDAAARADAPATEGRATEEEAPEPAPAPARTPRAKPEKAIDPAEDPRGHRDRVRQRYADKGADALADYEFVELILFRVIRQGDVKPTAKRLLGTFGSVGAMLAAPEENLLAVKGVGPKVVEEFRFLHAVAVRAAREGVARREVLSSWDDVLAYCRIAMAGKAREEFRILLLDKKNRLIHDEVQQVGTVDHTPVYPREVIALALKTHASAVILVHNHPSGDPTPSSADVRMTKQLVDIATPLGIRVHDHIVIGRDGTASLRGLGLM